MDVTINLSECTAEFNGNDVWALFRTEEKRGGERIHEFGITEQDRQTLMSPTPPFLVDLDDGKGEYVGDGYWLLSRTEEDDGDVLLHTIAVNAGELELLVV